MSTNIMWTKRLWRLKKVRNTLKFQIVGILHFKVWNCIFKEKFTFFKIKLRNMVRLPVCSYKKRNESMWNFCCNGKEILAFLNAYNTVYIIPKLFLVILLIFLCNLISWCCDVWDLLCRGEAVRLRKQQIVFFFCKDSKHIL